MAPHKTVTINGRKYDAVTGLPIEEVAVKLPDNTPIKAPKPAAKPKAPATTNPGAAPSKGVHSSVQRSQTLHRRAAKKPAAPAKPVTKRNVPGRHMDIAKSASVARFAKHPTAPAPTTKATSTRATASVSVPTAASAVAKQPVQRAPRLAAVDAQPKAHPIVARATARTEAKKKATPAKPTTAKEVKEAEIEKALAAPKPKQPKTKKLSKNLRRALIVAGIVLGIVLILVAVWRLVPTISVSMAAAQAGIEASYPEYTPDGFSLSQPVTYSDGQVTLKFASHSNDNYYTIDQTRSSWDSSAVLDNVVTPAAGANYVTTKERGLTIYTYESSAAWVNGGILYKIDSQAPLSGDQIRRIATSL